MTDDVDDDDDNDANVFAGRVGGRAMDWLLKASWLSSKGFMTRRRLKKLSTYTRWWWWRWFNNNYDDVCLQNYALETRLQMWVASIGGGWNLWWRQCAPDQMTMTDKWQWQMVMIDEMTMTRRCGKRLESLRSSSGSLPRTRRRPGRPAGPPTIRCEDGDHCSDDLYIIGAVCLSGTKIVLWWWWLSWCWRWWKK